MLGIKICATLDKCKHKFCFSCIKKWEKFHKICPLCRSPFSKILNDNNENNYIIIGGLNESIHDFMNNKHFLKSHKTPNIMMCSICQKKGTSSSMFICQICNTHIVHYWCESPEYFKFGIYICPVCDSNINNQNNEI